MKKWLCFWGAMFCFLFCALSVRADVIWEPQDSFFEKHECTYVGRCFTANGPDGVVILYKSPESPKVVTTWENGFVAYISHTYEDGNGVLWGIYDDFEQTGWMPMEYMEVVYDYISFAEEHSGEIVEQRGALEEQYRGEDVCFWNYPGAEEPDYIMSLTESYLPEYSSVYTDEKGHSWGYIGYYFGHRNVWVCMDQPTADYGQLYPDGGPKIGQRDDVQDVRTSVQVAQDVRTSVEDEQDIKTSVQVAERIVPGAGQKMPVTAAVLVALVVLVTAALLVVLKKKTEGRE